MPAPVNQKEIKKDLSWATLEYECFMKISLKNCTRLRWKSIKYLNTEEYQEPLSGLELIGSADLLQHKVIKRYQKKQKKKQKRY